MGKGLFLLVYFCCAHVSASGIHFSQGWLRETPRDYSSAAIYGRLVNNSDGSELLKSIRSDQGDSVMLHRSVRQHGLVGMVHLESMKIASGETVYFEPAGLDFMAIGLTEALVEGDCLELTLSFQSGKEIRVMAKVGTLTQLEYSNKMLSCLE